MESSKFKYPTFKPFDYDCTTVYPSDYDGLTDVLKTLINHSKIQNKKQGNKGRKQRSYLDLICAFDIETTNIEKYKQNIMYVWQFQLGLTTTIIGRTWDQFLQLLQYIKSLLPEDVWLCIFDHNLSYEFTYFKGIYAFNEEEVFPIRPRHVLKCDMMDKYEFRCSYMHSNMSLGQYTEKMRVTHVKQDEAHLLIGNKKFSYKKKRYPWTRIEKHEYPYIINDVLGLVEAVTTDMQSDNDTISSFPLTSTGYIRREVKRAMQDIRYNQIVPILPDLNIINLLEDAFRGGDTHANRWFSGHTVKDAKGVDRSSSYPDTECNRPMPMSKWIKVSKECLTTDKLYDLIDHKKAVIFRCDMFNVKMKDDHFPNPYIAKAKCTSLHGAVEDNGRVLSADYLTTALCDLDYKIIDEIYDFDIVITDMYFCRYGMLPDEYTGVIKKLYRDKTELKNVAGQEIFYTKQKNKLNSVYGMSAQHVLRVIWKYMRQSRSETAKRKGGFDIDRSMSDDEQLSKAYRTAFSSYAWGVYTTAWARYELYLGQKIVYNTPGCYLLYWDTDSLKFVGDPDFTEYNNEKVKQSTLHNAFAKDPDGVMHFMGVFEPDGEYIEFKTLGAKKYIYTSLDKDKKTGEEKINLHTTIAGVSKKAGAEELIEKSKIENKSVFDLFSDGFCFKKAGGLDATYNDLEKPMIVKLQGHELKITDNVYLEDGEYTLGITDDYETILEYYSMKLIDADMIA